MSISERRYQRELSVFFFFFVCSFLFVICQGENANLPNGWITDHDWDNDCFSTPTYADCQRECGPSEGFWEKTKLFFLLKYFFVIQVFLTPSQQSMVSKFTARNGNRKSLKVCTLFLFFFVKNKIL